MLTSRKLLRFFLVAPLVLIALPSRGAEPTTQPAGAAAAPAVEPKSFMRFVDDGHSGGKLESAVVTYRNAGGVTVRLVGAIHIGERSYFDGLNDSFRADDAVLYELVKPKDGGLPRPGVASDNPISKLQHFLKDTLNLCFQLDVIDYSRPNFVHADLDKETFERMQAERGESFESLMLQQLMSALSHPQPEAAGPNGEQSLDALIETFTRPDMERQIKLLVARQLEHVESGAMGLDGPGGSVILTERNKAALKVLADTITAGRKHISIFYGAAHLPDMSRRLQEMGFTPITTEWRMAWDLTIRADQPSAVEKLLKELLRSLDEPDPANVNPNDPV